MNTADGQMYAGISTPENRQKQKYHTAKKHSIGGIHLPAYTTMEAIKPSRYTAFSVLIFRGQIFAIS